MRGKDILNFEKNKIKRERNRRKICFRLSLYVTDM